MAGRRSRHECRPRGELVLKGLPERVLVFIDEAYYEFAAGASDYPNSLALLKKQRNIIIGRTFSKLFGLAGLRIGYGIGNAEVIDLMNRVREPFNVTSVAQAAALAVLKDQPYYNRILAEMNRERDKLCAALTKLGVDCSKGRTNFIQVRTASPSREVSLALLKKGVIVRDMAAWGLTNYIRVTIGTPSENARFLKALKEAL